MSQKTLNANLPEGVNEVIIGAKADESKDVELMEAIPKEKQLTVTFNGISGWVPIMHKADPPLQKLKNIFTPKHEVDEAAKVQRKQVKTRPTCFFGGRGNKRHVQLAIASQIMYRLAGACYPGEVLALMGPSGSSKTSLLSVVGGRTPKSVILEGDVLYNNARLTKATKRSVGYVLQVGARQIA